MILPAVLVTKKSYPKKDQTTKTNRSWDKRMLSNEQFLKINQDLINKCPEYFYARYSSVIFPNSESERFYQALR